MGGIDMVRQIAPKTQLGLIKSRVNQGGETITPEIVYPESDGKPMADNTEQFKWIVKIKENLEVLFKSNPDVLVSVSLMFSSDSLCPKMLFSFSSTTTIPSPE